MPSISTATPSGRLAADTADRACRPASPNAATRKSDAPLITFGWSVKSAVELTNPVSLTTRTSRDQSPPQAFFTCASRLIAQVRAAAAPSSMLMPSPSRPLINAPSACEICPETCTSAPTTTNGT